MYRKKQGEGSVTYAEPLLKNTSNFALLPRFVKKQAVPGAPEPIPEGVVTYVEG